MQRRPYLCPGDRVVPAPVLDRDAIEQHPVHRAAALHERRQIHALAVGIFQRFRRKVDSDARAPGAGAARAGRLGSSGRYARRRARPRRCPGHATARSPALRARSGASSTTDSVKAELTPRASFRSDAGFSRYSAPEFSLTCTPKGATRSNRHDAEPDRLVDPWLDFVGSSPATPWRSSWA